MSDYLINLMLVATVFLLLWSLSVKIALNNLSWGRLRKLDLKDSSFEKRVSGWIENRDTILLIIDVINIFFILLGATLLCRHILEIAPATSSGVLIELGMVLVTALIFVVISSLVSLKLHSRDCLKLLSLSVPFLTALSYILFPLIMLIRYFAEKARKEGGEHDAATVEDEILSLVEQDAHAEEDRMQPGLEADERKMIRGIFDLDNTFVREIMTPRVDIKGVEVNSAIAEVKTKIIESGHSRLPVYRESLDEIIGIVYAKDLLDDSKVMGHQLSDLLHKPPFIPESKNIGDLLDDLRLNKQHMAVIIDEYGGTSGVVTIEDILEEIVGEIQDEFDTEEEIKPFLFNEDGSIDLEGRLYIDEFNELLNSDIEEDENFDTLAGFITDSIGRIPAVDEEFELEGLNFKIVEADDRRIIKIRVNRIAAEA